MAELLLRGLFPAFPTPVTPEGGVDEDTLARLVDYQVTNGAAGLVPMGGTGEATAFSLSERHRTVRATVTAAAGRVPVIAGVLDAGLGGAIESAAAYQAAGADALMVIPPYYSRPDQAGVQRYFRALARETKLPLMLYDNPYRSHVVLTPGTIAAMAEEQLIVGMKASNTDLYHLNQLAQYLPPSFGLLSGQDTLFVEQVLMGAKGGILTSACLIPHVWNKVLALVEGGNAAEALALHRKLQPFMNALFAGEFPGAVRFAFQLLHLPIGCVRPPSGPLLGVQEAALRHALDELKRNGLILTGPPAQGAIS